jgi:hypothetical protein
MTHTEHFSTWVTDNLFNVDTTNSSVATRSMSDMLAHSLVGPEKGLALLPPIDRSTDNITLRGIIKVSMTRYNAWLAEVSARGKSTIFQ